MNYRDAEGKYVFKESLVKRSQELKETVERFAVVIWPLVVKEEGFMLVDGYCRYTTLKALKVSRTYVYAGSLSNPKLNAARHQPYLNTDPSSKKIGLNEP
jgi:hypothetical protein